MYKLFKELTTEENITNFARVISIFVVIACMIIIVQVLTHPDRISFGLID